MSPYGTDALADRRMGKTRKAAIGRPHNNQDDFYGGIVIAQPLREFIRVVHLMNAEQSHEAVDP